MISLVSITAPEFMTAPPLGLLYVGGALRQAGYEVEVHHLTPDQIEDTARRIAAQEPEFVGFSAFTCNQTRFSADMSRRIRALCSSPVVWGGVHASLVPDQTLAEDYVDAIVIGEGEETIVELAEALAGRRDFAGVPGIGYKEAGELHFTGKRPLIEDLDRYRMDWDLVDINRYLVPDWGKQRVLNYVTSRGCPFKCGFCYNLRFNEGRWRGHSTQFVIDEITRLKEEYGLEGIRYYDDNFFGDKKRALEIIETVDLPWEGELRIGYITEEMARKLRDTKCQGICFGIESGNDRVLKIINKGQSLNRIMKGIEIMSHYPEVRVSTTLIIGNPTETRDEIKNTVDVCLKLWKIHPRIKISIGTFIPFPGVPVYELVRNEGYVPPARTEDWEVMNRTNTTRELTWLPWVTEKDRKDFIKIGRYALLLQFGNLKVPLVNRIPYWRLSRYDFRLPVELPLLEWLERKFEDRQSRTSRTMRRLLPYLGRKGRVVSSES